MQVNWNPFLTLFLWTWFGRLAKPTYPMSFLRTTGGMPFCTGAGDDVEPFAVPFKEGASPLGVPICESDIWIEEKTDMNGVFEEKTRRTRKGTHVKRWRRWRGLGGRSVKKRVVAQRTPTSCLHPLFGRWRPDSIPFSIRLLFSASSHFLSFFAALSLLPSRQATGFPSSTM